MFYYGSLGRVYIPEIIFSGNPETVLGWKFISDWYILNYKNRFGGQVHTGNKIVMNILPFPAQKQVSGTFSLTFHILAFLKEIQVSWWSWLFISLLRSFESSGGALLGYKDSVDMGLFSLFHFLLLRYFTNSYRQEVLLISFYPYYPCHPCSICPLQKIDHW